MWDWFSYNYNGDSNGIKNTQLVVRGDCPQNIFNYLVASNNIKCIRMEACTEIYELPDNIKYSKILEYIDINDCLFIKKIKGFPSLKAIEVFNSGIEEINGCENLEIFTAVDCPKLHTIDCIKDCHDVRIEDCIAYKGSLVFSKEKL
jgi:hypothetical protein